MDLSMLEGICLSKGEIKVYLALLELGSTKVGRIIEKSKMVSSAVHNALNSLREKGFVSYIKKGKIRFYQATHPRHMLDMLDDRKKQITEILPYLETKSLYSKNKQEAEIFEGFGGILSMLHTLINDAGKGDEFLFFRVSFKENDEGIQKFFLRFDLARREKGLVTKGLAPIELKKIFSKQKSIKVKYPSFPIPAHVAICKNKVAFFSWDEKPVGYLIRSMQISGMFRSFFKKVWDSC